MPQQPQVLDGMRAPRSVRLDEIRGVTETTPTPVERPNATTYVSQYRGYMVQVTAPRTVFDAHGRKQAAKPVMVRFEDGVYRNDARDPELRKLIDETLQSNPYFGAFGDARAHFWLADDQRQKTEAARIQSALSTLRSLPKEAVDEFVSALRQGDAEDHDLNAAK